MNRFNTIAAVSAAFALTLAQPALACGDHDVFSGNGGEAVLQSDAPATACIGQHNDYGPMEYVSSVEDGVGDTLVWLSDRDGDLWACNADSDGNVYAYVVVGLDLLDGAGQGMMHQVRASSRDPLAGAAELCRMMPGDGATVAAYVDDGFGDVLAWIEYGDNLFMCNASVSGALWLFEEVGTPINGGGGIEAGFPMREA